MSALRILVALAVLSTALLSGAGVAVADAESSNPANATLVSAYPNPVADGDPGEFVAIRFDKPTNTTGWTLTDGHTTATLPNRTLNGTVAVAVNPGDARQHTEHPVFELGGRLQLADSGDSLELRYNSDVVSSARYRNAPVSERRDFETESWKPIGATGIDPIRTDGGTATAFVLPDAPDITLETIETADERVLIGGYTFTSERITEALIDRADAGVETRVLLDGAPVGGASTRQARLLDRLVEAGIDVRLLAGPHTRYRHHHPKYAVVDDRAIVTTENFKPAGTGGMSSRGWGVSLENARSAEALASLHESDRTWRAAVPWEQYRAGRSFSESDPAVGEYPTTYEPERVTVDEISVLVAPDNADDALVEKIDRAEDRILVQQVRIDSRENRLLRAILRAAERGVTVRVHLGGSWYVEDENEALAEWLNNRADASGWNLEARVDDSDGYGKIHTKGLVIDDTAVIGSLNWVQSAKSDNREVLVALHGTEPATYYATVFFDDWTDDDRRSLPVGLLVIVAAGGAGTLLVLGRVGFVGRTETITDWQW